MKGVDKHGKEHKGEIEAIVTAAGEYRGWGFCSCGWVSERYKDEESVILDLQEHLARLTEDEECPTIGVRSCGCGNVGCKAVRVFIINPQIDEEGVVYATVPGDVVPGFIAALRSFSRVKNVGSRKGGTR